MSPGDRRGVSLVEVMFVTGLASLVLMTIISLSLSMGRSSLNASRSQASQIDLSYATQLVERELRQATFVTSPSAGATATTLEGCGNAAILPGGGAPEALDAASPMRWFAVCAAGGRVHYHNGAGCPAIYACGVAPQASFGAGPGLPATALFSRATAQTTRVDVTLTVPSADQTATAQTAVAFAAAAGSNQ